MKARVDELNEKIKEMNRLIDEIVYDLYEFTDEEIEIVEEVVNDSSYLQYGIYVVQTKELYSVC